MTRKHARKISPVHLVSDEVAGLNEVEYGLNVAKNAFGLWCVWRTAVAIVKIPLAVGWPIWGDKYASCLSFMGRSSAAQPIYRCGQVR